MQKYIVLIYILVVGILVTPIAIAAPKEKDHKKNSRSKTVQNQKNKKDDEKSEQKKAQDQKKKLKKEIKEWKQKKKHIKPLQLKDLLEENHQLRIKNGEMTVAVNELKTKLEETIQAAEQNDQHEQNEKREQNELAHQKFLEIQKQIQTNLACRDLSELPAGSYTINQTTGEVLIGGIVDNRYGVDRETGIPFIKGTIFKVQIGAKDDLDLKEILIDEVNHENLEQEVANGLFKYTIGHFRNYWEADKLKKGLRSMGIQLAWIVPYKDGKRVILKEVLPIVIDQKSN